MKPSFYFIKKGVCVDDASLQGKERKHANTIAY